MDGWVARRWASSRRPTSASSSATPVELIGGGAGAYAVDAVRDGRWYATFVTLPFDEGLYAADIAIDAARGLPVTPRCQRLLLPRASATATSTQYFAASRLSLARWICAR